MDINAGQSGSNPDCALVGRVTREVVPQLTTIIHSILHTEPALASHHASTMPGSQAYAPLKVRQAAQRAVSS